ncbi:translational GTPase TypA [Pontiella sulfatireligans]|uniref:Large ribosomal subunit assembly factor BipA n=1 Tax=Pontiella sulfatireligans TaxID=2750658 RepID=A0A6C2ULS9_9BACT|nr:translational GTPase TypA [Pontiella sulfatireligans]VGO20264.1 GTP-binding protein TypA/BipA [Pontiella sulfatireligans]
MAQEIRNIAIIAHVDHGKTTLVDEIIKQAHLFRDNEDMQTCMLDSNDLERERGITILSKNISVVYKGVKINVIDTPGHSDFGGQVERVLNLADGVLLLVDAAEGPMPQTRFVLDKALELNLKAVVIINKIDKPDARPDVIHDKVFDLFAELDANDDQLDFPMLYCSGKDGWADKVLDGPRNSILPLMDAILEYIPAPEVREGPVQMQVTSLDYNDYVGRIGVGRVYRGTLNTSTPLMRVYRDGTEKRAAIKQLFTFEGLTRVEVDEVPCGDLCAIVGIPDIDIGDSITDFDHPEALPPISIDQPTLSMVFTVNDSPFFGKDGKYVTSRHLRERLLKETERDVALHVDVGSGDSFRVSGRGVLHLSILIETMRREGFEMCVSQPQVILKEKHGKKEEPIEVLHIDVPNEYAGKAIELAGTRKGEMLDMEQHGLRKMIRFQIPTRGLIGLRSKMLTATAGEAIVSHRFLRYEPYKGPIQQRNNGVLVSQGNGDTVAFAIDALQLRGTFFVTPGEACYEGMIVAEHCIDKDLVVNIQKAKAMSNVRASGTDRAMKIAPAQVKSLEESLEYIAADELVEITPNNIRLRKRLLTENDRKRNSRKKTDD